MNQNSKFAHVKRNNNNSEGVDGDKQCSSNVKKAPPPNQTKCNQFQKLENGMTHV